MPRDDGYSQLDPLIAAASRVSPWSDGTYFPDMDLLRQLLTVPISQGEKQESGRPAKAFDAWIAHELRRSGFPENAVWPRARRPRVVLEELGQIEDKLERLQEQLRAVEATAKLAHPGLRRAIRDLDGALPGWTDAYILGDFYSKQIDVGISSWRRGPDILISTKTMFSAYRKNLKNRHEEAVGEVFSLRRRHPMSTMGYAYLVRSSIFDEPGAYAILQDILARLRRPGEAFDATLLLVAKWDDTQESPQVTLIEEPDVGLGAGRFFSDIVSMVEARTPVREHAEVRKRHGGEPTGGIPLGVVDEGEDLDSAEDDTGA